MPAHSVYISNKFMKISPELKENIRLVHGDEGLLWLTRLPDAISSLSEKWNVRFVFPLPGLSYNFVAEFLNAQNESLIVKMRPAKMNLKAEAQWLQSFPQVCPQVIGFDESFNALFMEKISPGTTLKSLINAGQDDEATRIIARTILNLQSRKVLSSGYKKLDDLCADYKSLDGIADSYLLDKARDLHRSLCQNAEPQLLHGDLHHDNILANHGTWSVIDPHGYIGDVVSEMGVMMYNPVDRIESMGSLEDLMARRLAILKEELPYDPQRMKAWAFCKTVISAAWFQEDSSSEARFQLDLAQVIDDLKI